MASGPAIRRGLLISSPRNGLTATGPSLARMRGFLGRQGFVIADEHCIDGDQATRTAIMAGFDALLEATQPTDIVVFYYAGHGGLFPDLIGTTVRPHPVLEPMDIADSDATHFNGLLGGELRLFIRALARLCDNVTAIFDCCHASGLVETDGPTADNHEDSDRAALAAIAQRAGERIARRRLADAARHDPTRSGSDPANTGAVRLVASSASECAYAYPDQSMLLFTDILVTVLEEHALADGLSWEQIIRLVRARVQELRPEQRPGVEGARDRRPFTTEVTLAPTDHFHVQREGLRLRLAAGKAAGIRLHDRFELGPYGSHDGPLLGTGTATAVKPFHAFLELPRDQGLLPSVMFARRVRGEVIDLAARLTTSPRASPAAVAQHAALAVSGYRLRALEITATTPGDLDLLDELNPDDDPTFTPQCVAHLRLADPNIADELARAARRLERWAGLATQIGNPGLGPLAGCYTLTWGRLDGDTLRPLRPGRIVLAGDPLGLRLHNPGRVSALHVQAFRVRADRCIAPWRDVDGGLAIKTSHELALHETFERVAGLPGLHREWLVIAIGDGAFDLGALTTPVGDRPRIPGTRSYDQHPGEASRVEILGVSYILGPAS